jgi:hypothetical protein
MTTKDRALTDVMRTGEHDGEHRTVSPGESWPQIVHSDLCCNTGSCTCVGAEDRSAGLRQA